MKWPRQRSVSMKTTTRQNVRRLSHSCLIARSRSPSTHCYVTCHQRVLYAPQLPPVWIIHSFSHSPMASNYLPQVEPRNLRRLGKNSGPILSPCRPKFMKLWNDIGDPLYFSKPLPDCLYHGSFRRYSPLSLKVVEKLKNVKGFGSKFLAGTTPTFLRQIVSAIYCPSFGQIWLSSVCWSLSAKTGNVVNAEFMEGG